MSSGSSDHQKAKRDGKPPPLTPKMEKFCRLYVNIDYTALRAYREAYDNNTAKDRTIMNKATNLLKDPRIVERVIKLRKKIETKLEITAERIEAEYAAIAFARLDGIVKWGVIEEVIGEDDRGADIVRKRVYVEPRINSDDLTADQAASIAEVALTDKGFKIKMHDKLKALDKLANRFKQFNNRFTLEDPQGDSPFSALARALKEMGDESGDEG